MHMCMFRLYLCLVAAVSECMYTAISGGSLRCLSSLCVLFGACYCCCCMHACCMQQQQQHYYLGFRAWRSKPSFCLFAALQVLLHLRLVRSAATRAAHTPEAVHLRGPVPFTHLGAPDGGPLSKGSSFIGQKTDCFVVSSCCCCC